MRGPSVILQLLWEEYRSHTPDGYGYSQYYQLYRNWLDRQAISLRQEHRTGEKLFVDFAGDTIRIVDPRTGTITLGQLFVAVLGCSIVFFKGLAHCVNIMSSCAWHGRRFLRWQSG
jgi:transposase